MKSVKNQYPNKPKISIVILNWNGIKDTLDCLASLQCIDYPKFNIIVVDNGSEDATEAIIIKNRYPKIHLIKSAKNLGFAKGNNLGIKRALNDNAEFILLLNNDTEVEPDFLEKMVWYMLQNQDVGIASAVIYTYKKPHQPWFSYGDYYKLFASIKACHKKKDFDKEKIYFVTGCSMFLKKKMLEKIGLLDERFFAYFEDAELCIRAKRLGYKIGVAEKAVVYHKISKSSGGVLGPIYLYYMTRNNWLFAQMTLAWYEWPIFFIFFIFYKIFFTTFKLLIRPQKNKLISFKAIFQGFLDALRGNYGEIKSKIS